MGHGHVTLQRDEDGYPPYEVEEIDASPVGGGRYRIEGIPVFVHGLARGDIAKVARTVGDERTWVTEVLEPAVAQRLGGRVRRPLPPGRGLDPLASPMSPR